MILSGWRKGNFKTICEKEKEKTEQNPERKKVLVVASLKFKLSSIFFLLWQQEPFEILFPQNEDNNLFQERRSSANLVIKRADLGGSPTATMRTNNKSPSPATRAITSQAIITQCSPIEKCDAWVKNRDNELGNFSSKVKEQLSAKPPTVRRILASSGHSTPLSLRGNSVSSPQKDSSGPRSTESSASSTGMDYSKYTDMFKNVLEFYGTRRLRPKSHSAVEQLLSMKTWQSHICTERTVGLSVEYVCRVLFKRWFSLNARIRRCIARSRSRQVLLYSAD